MSWFSIHRSLFDSKYGRNVEMIGFWVYLIGKANHADGYDCDGVLIKRGCLKTGRKILKAETGLSESKVERFLKKLEIEHQIEQQKTTKYRIISIINYDNYQRNEQRFGQQADNKRTTSEQQVDTNNKNNNNNNKNKNNKLVAMSDDEGCQKNINQHTELKQENKTDLQNHSNLIGKNKTEIITPQKKPCNKKPDNQTGNYNMQNDAPLDYLEYSKALPPDKTATTRDVGYIWNALASLEKLPQITFGGVTWINRQKKIKKYLSTYSTVKDWKIIFNKAADKGFTKSDGCEWRPNFDYVFRNDNPTKLFEEYLAEGMK